MNTIRDELIAARDAFQLLINDAIVFTGQDGQNDGLAPGAFCRYCEEEILLDDPEIDQWEYHADNCNCFSFMARVGSINEVLDQ